VLAVGQSIYDTTDVTKVRDQVCIVRDREEVRRGVPRSGEGGEFSTVEYVWPRPGETEPAPKASYALPTTRPRSGGS
jgi:hypothetical protein